MSGAPVLPIIYFIFFTDLHSLIPCLRWHWISPFSERKQLNDAWITNFYVNIEREAVGVTIAHSYGSFRFCQISFCQAESLAMLNLLHPSDQACLRCFWFLCLVSPPFLIWVCLYNLMFTFVRFSLYASAVTKPHCNAWVISRLDCFHACIEQHIYFIKRTFCCYTCPVWTMILVTWK